MEPWSLLIIQFRRRKLGIILWNKYRILSFSSAFLFNKNYYAGSERKEKLFVENGQSIKKISFQKLLFRRIRRHLSASREKVFRQNSSARGRHLFPHSSSSEEELRLTLNDDKCLALTFLRWILDPFNWSSFFWFIKKFDFLLLENIWFIFEELFKCIRKNYSFKTLNVWNIFSYILWQYSRKIQYLDLASKELF